MRILRLLNRTDLAEFGRGTAFDIICTCGEHHTLQAEHAYKKALTNGHGSGASAPAVTPKARKRRRKRRQFSAAFKRRAVRRVAKGEIPARVARSLDVSATIVRDWVKQATHGAK